MFTKVKFEVRYKLPVHSGDIDSIYNSSESLVADLWTALVPA